MASNSSVRGCSRRLLGRMISKAIGGDPVNLLIVEDDDGVSSFLKQATTEAGYNAEVVGDGVNALRMARSEEFDLILLDVMLPRMNGFDVCRELRGAANMTPILMITARDSLEDKIEGLDSGADDYIVKPFQVAELLARARALLRRGESSPVVLKVADLTLSPATRRAIRDGKTIHLSATEYSLLEYLMRNAGRVLTRSMILQHVWQYDFEGNDNVLDVYINYLRNKIDKGHPVQLIHTVRGVGYRVDADGS
jgi:DNA-binding response OmpR family regulator